MLKLAGSHHRRNAVELWTLHTGQQSVSQRLGPKPKGSAADAKSKEGDCSEVCIAGGKNEEDGRWCNVWLMSQSPISGEE